MGRGGTRHPTLPAPTPVLLRLRLFFLPHVRGDTRNAHVHAKRLFDPAFNCIPCRYAYCALNGSCATRYAPGTPILIIIERRRGVDDKSERRRGNRWFFRARGCNHFRITASDRDGYEIISLVLRCKGHNGYQM